MSGFGTCGVFLALPLAIALYKAKRPKLAYQDSPHSGSNATIATTAEDGDGNANDSKMGTSGTFETVDLEAADEGPGTITGGPNMDPTVLQNPSGSSNIDEEPTSMIARLANKICKSKPQESASYVRMDPLNVGIMETIPEEESEENPGSSTSLVKTNDLSKVKGRKKLALTVTNDLGDGSMYKSSR